MKAVSRHDIDIDSKAGRKPPPHASKIEQIEIGCWIVVDDHIDILFGPPSPRAAEPNT